MKFFIKTYHTQSVRTYWFRKNYVIDFLAIGIVAENGSVYSAISKEFNPRYVDDKTIEEVTKHFPRHTAQTWRKKADIITGIKEFIQWETAQTNTEAELVFESHNDFSALVALMGGTNNTNWPVQVPKTYMNLIQSISEYISDIDDTELVDNGNYTHIPIQSGKPFRMYEKMDIFQSHVMYPLREYGKGAIEDARYMRDLYNFFKLVKNKKDIPQEEEL